MKQKTRIKIFMLITAAITVTLYFIGADYVYKWNLFIFMANWLLSLVCLSLYFIYCTYYFKIIQEKNILTTWIWRILAGTIFSVIPWVFYHKYVQKKELEFHSYFISWGNVKKIEFISTSPGIKFYVSYTNKKYKIKRSGEYNEDLNYGIKQSRIKAGDSILIKISKGDYSNNYPFKLRPTKGQLELVGDSLDLQDTSLLYVEQNPSFLTWATITGLNRGEDDLDDILYLKNPKFKIKGNKLIKPITTRMLERKDTILIRSSVLNPRNYLIYEFKPTKGQLEIVGDSLDFKQAYKTQMLKNACYITWAKITNNDYYRLRDCSEIFYENKHSHIKGSQIYDTQKAAHFNRGHKLLIMVSKYNKNHTKVYLSNPSNKLLEIVGDSLDFSEIDKIKNL